MKSSGAIILYTVLRLAAFVVPFLVLIYFGVYDWLAAIIAAIIGLVFSLIALRWSRDRVAMTLHERSRGTKRSRTNSDEDSEDQAAS